MVEYGNRIAVLRGKTIMSDTRKLFDLMTDEKNPIWKWLPNNSEMFKFAKYLAENNTRVITQCKDCRYSRGRNENEEKYLNDTVLVCTCPEAIDNCWNPVHQNHFCRCGITEEGYRMSNFR